MRLKTSDARNSIEANLLRTRVRFPSAPLYIRRLHCYSTCIPGGYMKTTTVECGRCSTQFQKRTAEYNRQLRKNPDRTFYCSRSCAVAAGNIKSPRGQIQNLRKGSTCDEYSPFRPFLRKCKGREKEVTITLKDLKSLWEQQEGRCALSGTHMPLPKNESGWHNLRDDPTKPTVDRIDNNLGYVPGNVRFITHMANLARHNYSDEQVLNFCSAVYRHHLQGHS